MAAISRRQRSIHAATGLRSAAIPAKVRPSPSSVASLPLNSCQRRTMTSQYFGSNSISARLAAGLLARDQRRAGPAERIEHRVAALAAVPDGALHQLDRLHRRVQVVDVRLLDEPHVALVAGAAPEVIRAFLPAVQDRFVLALVVRPPHRERVLRPDDERGPVAARLAERLLQRVQSPTTTCRCRSRPW